MNDVSQLTFMLEKAAAYGYKDAGFILDRGYFSEENIRFMDKNGYEFIIMVKGCKDLVSKLILKNRGTFEDEWERTIPYYEVNGITVKAMIFLPGRLLRESGQASSVVITRFRVVPISVTIIVTQKPSN